MHHTTGPIALNGLMESQSKAFSNIYQSEVRWKELYACNIPDPQIYILIVV